MDLSLVGLFCVSYRMTKAVLVHLPTVDDIERITPWVRSPRDLRSVIGYKALLTPNCHDHKNKQLILPINIRWGNLWWCHYTLAMYLFT